MNKRNAIAFILFFFLCGCTSKHPIKIGIQPYEGMKRNLSDTIADALRQTYQAEVEVMKSIPLPGKAFVNTKTPRYRADSLIRFLATDKADSFDYILGLTTYDISFTKKNADGSIKKPASRYADWGIFGLGDMPGSSCVVSSYRLQHPDQKVFINRLKKVAIHELGHNLGLPHCNTKGCVMQDAVERIQTIDQANASLCSTCKKSIE
ncbi:MAG: putative archaelysin family metalloprotease precursor [Cytophagaceae bacterium]|jgi:archaemetzincin|nr:putative archaelysin family metalloprotease precursor [Cytophagaceae bacterium]